MRKQAESDSRALVLLMTYEISLAEIVTSCYICTLLPCSRNEECIGMLLLCECVLFVCNELSEPVRCFALVFRVSSEQVHGGFYPYL